MATQGNYFGLYVNSQRIALTKSNDISLKRSFDDITTKDSSGYKESIPTMMESSGTMEGVFTSSLVNLLQYPEDFNNAAWYTDGTVLGTRIVAENGQKLAQVVNDALIISQSISGSYTIGQTITFSVYVKGTGTITLSVGDDDATATSSTITLTSSWVRHDISYLMTYGAYIFVKIDILTGTTISVCYPQLELNTVATSYRGSTETFAELTTLSEAGTQVQLIQTTNIDGDFSMAYNGLISDLQLKTKNDSAITFTCNFESSGTITKTTI